MPFLSQLQHPDILFCLDHKLPVLVTIYINLEESEITHAGSMSLAALPHLAGTPVDGHSTALLPVV